MSDILCSVASWIGVDWDRCKGSTVAKKIDTPVGVGCGGSTTVGPVEKDVTGETAKIDLPQDAQGEGVVPFLDVYDGLDIKDAGEVLFCLEGEKKSSYSGPAGTEGIGICQPNKWVCIDGKYKLIQVEVLLHDELCGNQLDDDCDELTDEGCEPLKDVVEDPDVFQPPEDVFSADEFNPLPDQISIPDVDGKDIYEVFFPDTLDIQELDTYELPPESCEIGNGGVLAEAEGIQFCNLPTVLTTNIPILPVCIKPTQEYKETQLNGAFPPRIMLGGVEGPLDEECNSKDTGFWAEVQLKPGENIIIGEITYKDKGPKSMQISVTYDPNCSTAGQNLIYGISNNQIVVIDADYGWMMGKIYSSLPGYGPKNLVLFIDYSKVFSPREAGVDVIDTASNKVVNTIVNETGGYAALNEAGTLLFVNRHTNEGGGFYKVNVFDTQNWKILLSFPASCSQQSPILVKSDKAYIAPTGTFCSMAGIDVYYLPNYLSTKKIPGSLIDPLHATSPSSNLLVSGDWGTTIVDTIKDEVLYSFETPPYLSILMDAAFSPDDKTLYLATSDGLIAHSLEFKATLWMDKNIDWMKNDNWVDEIALSPQGTELFAFPYTNNHCGKSLAVYDAKSGKVLKIFKNIPIYGINYNESSSWCGNHAICGDMIYKPAY